MRSALCIFICVALSPVAQAGDPKEAAEESNWKQQTTAEASYVTLDGETPISPIFTLKSVDYRSLSVVLRGTKMEVLARVVREHREVMGIPASDHQLELFTDPRNGDVKPLFSFKSTADVLELLPEFFRTVEHGDVTEDGVVSIFHYGEQKPFLQCANSYLRVESFEETGLLCATPVKAREPSKPVELQLASRSKRMETLFISSKPGTKAIYLASIEQAPELELVPSIEHEMMVEGTERVLRLTPAARRSGWAAISGFSVKLTFIGEGARQIVLTVPVVDGKFQKSAIKSADFVVR